MNSKGPYCLRSSYSCTRLADNYVKRPAIGDKIAQQYEALDFESGALRVLRVPGNMKRVQSYTNILQLQQ